MVKIFPVVSWVLVTGISHTIGLAFAAQPRASPSPPLPIVDLGYELHQAIAYNDSARYYNFSNIRYAAAPVGDLRFRAPTSPITNRSVVQTGAEPRLCPQAQPSWLGFRTWTAQYLAKQNITVTQAQVDALNASRTLANFTSQPVGAQEDCLFLDIMVPRSIFERVNSTTKKHAAVMVWLHGGGNNAGSKISAGNPAGLLTRSMTKGREGVIFVAINYRLGALGWSAGPTIQEDGIANAGFYDQRFALQWVQQYIHLFGGDPSRVAVIGESAGAASIFHQITAYGGTQQAPFSRAIMQSPGFRLQFSPNDLEAHTQRLFTLTNTSSIQQLRQLPSSALIAASTFQVWQSPFGEFTYGPSVDGCFVPALPGALLASGRFAKEVEVMIGHNLNEGLLFTPILYITEANYTEVGFSRFLSEDAFPQETQEVRDYIEFTLYPPIYNGSYGYTDMISRMAVLVSEVDFTCNVYYFGKALKGKDYSYYFTIYPGLHVADVAYTFYNPPLPTNFTPPTFNATAATALQDWLTTFAQSGRPRTPDVASVPEFTMWGGKGKGKGDRAEENGKSMGMSMELGSRNIGMVQDYLGTGIGRERCEWWQKWETGLE